MQSNLQPPNHHFNQYFECVKNKWNTNQEIADILYAAQSDPLSQCITSHVLVKPNSGTQIIFPRYDGAWFKNDEFVWRRRREGKLVREDHMKLKIHKQQVISANYVHSAICPTFHRRVYWLTHSPAYVLVHYLNESNAEKGIRKTAEIIADCMHANNVHQLTHQQLVQQLVPIYAHCLKPEEVQVLTSSVLEILQNLQNAAAATSSTPTSTNSPHFQLERRNSCSSASFRRGLSQMALRRQPSANSEIDANYIGTMMKKYGCVTIESSSASPPEKSACQNCRVATPRGGDVAMPSRSPSGDDATSEISTAATSVAPAASKLAAIVAISPPAAKPGDEIVVIGPWYLKGHSYDVAFGGQQVPARLIQAGVLAATVPPPGGTVATVPLRVYCNNLAVSMSKEFGVILPEEELEVERRVQRRKVRPRGSEEDTVDAEGVLYQILEKLRILAYALGVYGVWEQISTTFTPNESTLTNLVHQIHQNFVASHQQQILHHQLLGDHQSPAKTLLHHVAQLDFDLLFEALIQLSATLPGFHREFDVLSRDSNGATPLHQAARQNSTKVAKAILTLNANAIDVLDDRGRTPADVLNPEIFPVNATELWVLTNGETVTREHLLLSKLSAKMDRVTASCSSFGGATDFGDSDVAAAAVDQNLHVEISMDTDVHVPDSPKMARLFHVVTSPGIHVTDMARAKMADLARQIIEALPARIKSGPAEGAFFDADGDQVDFGAQHNPMLSSSGNSMDSSCHQFYDMMVVDQQSTTGGSVDTSRFTSSFDKGSFSESETLDFDKDLGEFFTIHLDAGIDPIQIRLANLKYNDDEQRDVYEAAMVIQRAYREYRARNTSRRQEDLERRAALKIQGCYRRYKQFCYFKKLHNAAIVVQKHFRMRKRGDADATGDAATEAEIIMNTVPEHPTLDGHAIRIQVPQTMSSLSLREHRAATTIQLAYRGHRKRQAAARKIQNFMRQSRNNDHHVQFSMTSENACAKRRRCSANSGAVAKKNLNFF